MDMRHAYTTDDLTSRRMASVSPVGTRPEKALRLILANLGIRCQCNCSDLPGRPDIVIPTRGAIIFVHGCFWHRHHGCERSSTPARNANLWIEKFQCTVIRDRRNQLALQKAGWRVLIVWECELKDLETISIRVKRFLA